MLNVDWTQAYLVRFQQQLLLNLADFSSIKWQNSSSFAGKSIEGNWQLEDPCKFLVNSSLHLQIGGR